MKQFGHDLSISFDTLKTVVNAQDPQLSKVKVNAVSESSLSQVDLSGDIINKITQDSDLSAWRQDAIVTHNGHIIAPNNYYGIDAEGRLYSHFTWDEAMSIEELVLKPAGWRLPEIGEWNMIIKDNQNEQYLLSTLNLRYEGWVPKPGAICRQKPRFTQLILGGGTIGALWTSTTCNDSDAYCILFDNQNCLVITSYDKRCGLSIRCISDNP